MATLFRVENPITEVGLWYRSDGEFTEFIKTLDEAQCRDLPMDFDPTMKDGGNWISACDNIPDMKNWFSTSDLHQLQQIGYGLYRFEVPTYRMANGHAIFLRESVVEFHPMDIKVLE